MRGAGRRGARRQRHAERGGSRSQPSEGFWREGPDPGGEGHAGGTGPRAFQAPSPSGEAPPSPPPSPLSVRVPALLFLPSSAFLPPSLSPSSAPTPNARLSAARELPSRGSPPGAPRRPPCPPRNCSPLLSQFLSFNVPSRLLPPRAPLQPPLLFSVLRSRTHSALRASLCSPLPAAQPRSSRRDPRGSGVPSPRRCRGGNPTRQVEGEMGRLGPVRLGPVSTRRRASPVHFHGAGELSGHHCCDCPR